jgi:serine/threonine protein kinase
MPQIDAETPDENLKNNAEAEYTSKAVTKMAAPNTGSAIPHQHHNQQSQTRHADNKVDGSHHHHSGRRDVTGNNIIGNRFKIGRRIGEGSFGIIYDGVDTTTNKHVAIKYESKKSEAPQLRDEYRTYKLLQGFTGIPNAYYFGPESMYNILVIDLLGPSLEDMFDTCNRKFSVKTVCLAAKQMLCRVQSVHEKSLVYRDIKPDNFLVGRIPPYVDTTENPSLDKDVNSILKHHSKEHPHPASQIYLIDFGMAKFYRDPKTLQHIPYKEKRSLSGTARYMSINTHLGREQSRRDDLEGLGHVLMYFLRGSLPWQGMKAATNKQKYEKIGEKKRTTPIKELCDGFPEEFAIYMNYVRKLGFEETPDYDYLRGLFDNVLKRMGEEEDNVFDWMIKLEEQRKEITRLREKQKSNANNSSQQIQQPPQKPTNLSVPGNVVNESITQNASMQVLRGGVDSVDEVANASNSQNLVDDARNQGNVNRKEQNTNSPLNNEIKMESIDNINEEENEKIKDNNKEDKEKETKNIELKEQENKIEKEEPKKEELTPEPTPEPEKEKVATPEPEKEKVAIPEPEKEKVATPEPEKEKVATPEPEKEKVTTPEPEKEKVTTPEPEKEKAATPEPISSSPATNEPVVASNPTPATATTTNPDTNNDKKDPPKKKSKGFFLFSCCTSSSE